MSLFDIELKSHRLKSWLGKSHSNRFKLVYLNQFLSDLLKKEEPEKYLSYFIEFLPQLIDLISTNQFSFFSPDEIDRLSFVVGSLINFKQLENKKSELEKCAGVLESAKEIIITKLSNKNNNEIERKNNSSTDSLNVVLVEANGEESCVIGDIQKLYLKSSIRESEFNEDKIVFERLNEKDIPPQTLKEIIETVKGEVFLNKKTTSSYNLTFSFNNDGCNYTGLSFGTAASALAYNSFLINHFFKKYYRFLDDVVTTGAVDENGNLKKLENEILTTKLNTVFFSGFSKFVIPEDNILEAKEELGRLNEKYPLRVLKLIPLRNFQDIFNNLEIVELKKLKIREKIKANYRRYHAIANLFLSVLIIAILSILTINFIIPELDSNPVYTDLKNNRYVAYNKYGNVVWESFILSKEVIEAYENKENVLRHILLSDLDEDGINEILLSVFDRNNKSLNKTLFCYNSDGSIKWKTVIPQKDSLYGSDFCSNDITILNMSILKNNGKKEIAITYCICSLFPTYVARINSNGEIKTEFYNPGCLHQIFNYDIDDDGDEELVCGGYNNDFEKSGALIVFDADYIQGCAPGYRFPKNVSKGLMKYYLLFPKTEVGKFTNHGSRLVSSIEMDGDQIVTTLKEVDSFTDENNKVNFQFYQTIYTLDKSFNVLHVETGSEFDVKYQQLVEEGKLEPVKDWKKYKEQLKSQVQWWDGDKFVNYPAINKYYLQAKSELDSKPIIN